MTKSYTLILLLTLIFSIQSLGQTVLQGNISDQDGRLIGAAVLLFKDDVQVKAVPTDFDGNYVFVGINEDSNYRIKISSLHLESKTVENIKVVTNKTTKVDVRYECFRTKIVRNCTDIVMNCSVFVENHYPDNTIISNNYCSTGSDKNPNNEFKSAKNTKRSIEEYTFSRPLEYRICNFGKRKFNLEIKSKKIYNSFNSIPNLKSFNQLKKVPNSGTEIIIDNIEITGSLDYPSCDMCYCPAIIKTITIKQLEIEDEFKKENLRRNFGIKNTLPPIYITTVETSISSNDFAQVKENKRLSLSSKGKKQMERPNEIDQLKIENFQEQKNKILRTKLSDIIEPKSFNSITNLSAFNKQKSVLEKEMENILIDEVIITEYRVPLISFDICCGPSKKYNTEELEQQQNSEFIKSQVLNQITIKANKIPQIILKKYERGCGKENDASGENQDKNESVSLDTDKVSTNSLSTTSTATVYPNPSPINDFIVIESNKTFDRIEVYNSTGNLVDIISVKNTTSTRISTPNIAGTYFLAIINESENSSEIKKIFVAN